MSHRFIKPLSLGALAVLALAFTAFTPAAHAAGTTITTRTTPDFDTFLADGAGHPLYAFDADTQTKGGKAAASACTGKCASAWPPVPAASAGKGVKASLIGTMKRKDGTVQATYNGYPLYSFVRDKSTGEPQGEGLEAYKGEWYLVKPDGSLDEEDAD